MSGRASPLFSEAAAHKSTGIAAFLYCTGSYSKQPLALHVLLPCKQWAMGIHALLLV